MSECNVIIQVEGDNKIACAHCTMCGESTRVCDTMSWDVAKQWAIRHVCVGKMEWTSHKI